MKLGFIYFTYKNDELLLQYSIESLKMLQTQHEISIFVVDDSKNPIDNIPNDVIYFKSYFERNGNLNGVECLKGMADVYNKIIDEYDCDYVVKIDPDVYVNSINWLNNINKDEIYQFGFVRHLKYGKVDPNICHGCFHGINKKGIENLLHNLNVGKLYKDEEQKEATRYAEDYFSCLLITNNDNKHNYYLTNYYNNPIFSKNDFGLFFDFYKPEYPKYINNIPFKFLEEQYSAITFKQLTYSKNSNYKRKEAECRMIQYASYKSQHTKFYVAGNLGNLLFYIARMMTFFHNYNTLSINKYDSTNISFNKLLNIFNFKKHIDYLPRTNIQYYQSEKYFDKDKVKQLFKSKFTYFNDRFKDIDFDNCVAITIRRGDYIALDDIWRVMPKEYYLNAYNKFFKGKQVIISSDEPQWIKENLSELNGIVVNKYTNDPLEILSILSRCKHHIGSCSTFSWWVAWLGEKDDSKIIFPEQWFNYDRRQLKETEKDIEENIIPERWIRFE